MQIRYDEWNRLVNIPVGIRKTGRLVRRGIVDQVMPDSSAMWNAADTHEPGRIFEPSEGYEIWVESVQLGDSDRYRLGAAI